MNFLLRYNGYCHCCRSQVIFESHDTWLRDNLFCNKCKSIPRQRAIQYILDKFFSHYTSALIHESSPSNNFISQYCTNYSLSHFFEDVPLGKKNDIGIECQNIEKLTFKDNTFDIFITQEVMEHVFYPNLASKEIMRVLKPGGGVCFYSW
jgi:SAM-dependent methyltransferase